MMNESQLAFVKEDKFDNPLNHKILSIFDKRFREGPNIYFHTFKYCCVYSINFTKIRKNEIINLPISDESVGLFELNKKLTVARPRGFLFKQTKNKNL